MSQAIIWPLIGGLGLLLLLTAQPIGRPRPGLAKRLAALQPDARPPEVVRVFASPELDRALVPPLRTVGTLALRLVELAGVPTSGLARRLELAGDAGGPAVLSWTASA